MFSILIEQNVQVLFVLLKFIDILILLELGDFLIGDFDYLMQIVFLGEVVVYKVVDCFVQLFVLVVEYVVLCQSQLVVVELDMWLVDEICFENLQCVMLQLVQKVMWIWFGQLIDQIMFDGDMCCFYGIGDFEYVNYCFFEELSWWVLVVEVVEKLWGLDYVCFGLGLFSDFKGDVYFNFLVSYCRIWLNLLGVEWWNDLQFGCISSICIEFYQLFNVEGLFFIVLNVSFEQCLVDLYQGNDCIVIYDMMLVFVGVDIGVQFCQFGVFRFGIQSGVLKLKFDIGL